MAQFAHIAFARNDAGEMVAARELFELAPASYTCAGCGKALRLRFARKGLTFFTHLDGPDCPLGAHLALRAAVLQLLADTRVIQTPPVLPQVPRRPAGRKKAPPVSLEEWDTGSVDAVVDNIIVDFLAETLAGKLGILVTLPGLTDPNRREQMRTLSIPVLEVVIAKPGEVHTFADLRDRLLDDTHNKHWLTHPSLEPEGAPVFNPTPLELKLGWTAEAQPLAGGEVKPSKTTSPLPLRQRPSEANPHLAFRQLSVSEKIEVIEKRMGCAQRKWSPLADMHVTGENSFGCDRQVWETDVYSHFVYEALQRHQTTAFSSENVRTWLEARYEIQPPFPNAERIAIYYYLEHLSREGCLIPLGGQRYKLAITKLQPGTHAQWDPVASFSVSRFLNAARACNLPIPYDEIERILVSFEEGPPSEAVEDFATAVAHRLHAQSRTVMAVLEKAGLIQSPGPSRSAVNSESSQGRLF
jgi:hypothetical protein